MCGAPSPSTVAQRGMNGSIEDAIRLSHVLSTDRSRPADILELREQMPRVVTEAIYNLVKSCAGVAALSMFVLALVPAPAAAQFVCGQAGTGSADGATAAAANSVACGTGASASGPFSTAIGALSTASGNFGTASGYQSTASGAASTATGEVSAASGDNRTATGAHREAAGNHSTAN